MGTMPRRKYPGANSAVIARARIAPSAASPQVAAHTFLPPDAAGQKLASAAFQPMSGKGLENLRSPSRAH